MSPQPITTVDAYIAQFPESLQLVLKEVRATIQSAAPDAQETIKYAMPTYTLRGNLVHFALFKNHLGFYATPNAHEAFRAELASYKQGKGSVQFPLDQPIPLDLIARMVQFRAAQNLTKATP